MTHFRLLLFLLILVSNQAFSQTKIVGKVIDEAAITLPGATVSLISLADTTKAQHTLSDDDGNFSFSKVHKGSYRLDVSYITYKMAQQAILVDNDPIESLTIRMEPSDNELSEVVIMGQKQSIRTKGGTTKMNVEDSNLAQSQSAYDLLKSLPGVSISKDGDIRVKGRSGVTVMIDGEPVEMGANQLKSLLKSTPGSTLKSVEVMNNPPASMDAAGNAGVINFVFSKKVKQGLNGTLTSGVSKSRYWKTDHGLSLSYGTGKWNFNLLYAFDYDYSWQRDSVHRVTEVLGTPLQMNQLQKTPHKSTGHLVKMNIDRHFNDKNTLSLNMSFNNISDPAKGHSLTTFGDAVKPDSLLRQYNNTKSRLTNWEGLLRHKLKFTDDKSLTTSFQTTYMKSDANESYNVEKFSPTISSLKYRNNYPSTINRYMFRSDYLHELSDDKGNKLGKIEFGVKSSLSNLKNDQLSENLENGSCIFDPIKSNKFNYKEAIQAAYASMELNVDNWSFRGGLRGEYTYVKGDSINNKTLVKQNYFSLFPNVEVGYNFNNLYSITLGYNRRIDRPEYDKLNPTVRMLDLYTFEKGNPRLKSQFSDNIELNQQFFSFVDLTVGYSFIKDPMYFSYITTPSLESYYTTINSGKERQWHASLSFPIPGIDWWENYHSVYAYNSQFNAKLNGQNFNEKSTSIGVFSFNSFKLPYNFSLELVGWYQSGGLHSNFKYKPLAEVNIGLNKKLLNDKLNLGISVSDVFYNGVFRGHTVSNNNEIFKINSRTDSRSVKFSLSWNFGAKAKKNNNESNEFKDDNRMPSSKSHLPMKPNIQDK